MCAAKPLEKMKMETNEGLPANQDHSNPDKRAWTLRSCDRGGCSERGRLLIFFKAKLTGGDYLLDLECKRKREAECWLHILFDLIKEGSYYFLT